MKTAFFLMSVYGLSVALTVLGVGSFFRSAGTKIDKLLFPWHWVDPQKPMGGAVHMFAHCPACVGFWIALGATWWHAPLGPAPLDRVAVALAATGVIWIVHVTLTKLGQYGL
jgi:hypothetical protein